MTLENFESVVEKKIVNRGFDYYEQDCIETVEQIDEGEFCAEVAGSSLYDVYVCIKNREIIEHSCTCPYDWGNVCKHVVAVLYHIRDAEILDEKPEFSVSEQAKTLLKKLSKKELSQFILNYLKKNKGFREDFFENFG